MGWSLRNSVVLLQAPQAPRLSPDQPLAHGLRDSAEGSGSRLDSLLVDTLGS